MALGFRVAGATGAGGLALSVSQPISNLVQVGDMIFWAVAAAENTRGWGGGISGGGSVASFTDLSTDPIAVVLNGRSQYQQDDGVSPRRWIWLGYRQATLADVGGVTYTASLISSPAFGVGIASAYVVYSNPGGSSPIYSLAANRQNAGSSSAAWVTPSSTMPGGATGTLNYVVSVTASSWKLAQTTVINGDTGDYHELELVYGEGGTGVWVGPGSVTDRVQWGGVGGPWYMMTWSDGPLVTGANLGRLPLLGAG